MSFCGEEYGEQQQQGQYPPRNPLSSESSSIPGLLNADSGSTKSWTTQQSGQQVIPPPGFGATQEESVRHKSGNTNRANKSRNRNRRNKGPQQRQSPLKEYTAAVNTSSDRTNDSDTLASSEAIRQLMKPPSGASISSASTLQPSFLDMDHSCSHSSVVKESHPILPQQPPVMDDLSFELDGSEDEDTFLFDGDEDSEGGHNPYGAGAASCPRSKKREWLLRMNRKLQDIPLGELDPATVPLPAIMNAWAKTKSAQGASMVEMWLKRAQQEYDQGNRRVIPTTKMYTMAGTY
jgi:hypothetical protein